MLKVLTIVAMLIAASYSYAHAGGGAGAGGAGWADTISSDDEKRSAVDLFVNMYEEQITILAQDFKPSLDFKQLVKNAKAVFKLNPVGLFTIPIKGSCVGGVEC